VFKVKPEYVYKKIKDTISANLRIQPVDGFSKMIRYLDIITAVTSSGCKKVQIFSIRCFKPGEKGNP